MWLLPSVFFLEYLCPFCGNSIPQEEFTNTKHFSTLGLQKTRLVCRGWYVINSSLSHCSESHNTFGICPGRGTTLAKQYNCFIQSGNRISLLRWGSLIIMGSHFVCLTFHQIIARRIPALTIIRLLHSRQGKNTCSVSCLDELLCRNNYAMFNMFVSYFRTLPGVIRSLALSSDVSFLCIIFLLLACDVFSVNLPKLKCSYITNELSRSCSWPRNVDRGSHWMYIAQGTKHYLSLVFSNSLSRQ